MLFTDLPATLVEDDAGLPWLCPGATVEPPIILVPHPGMPSGPHLNRTTRR